MIRRRLRLWILNLYVLTPSCEYGLRYSQRLPAARGPVLERPARNKEALYGRKQRPPRHCFTRLPGADWRQALRTGAAQRSQLAPGLLSSQQGGGFYPQA
jgi:hypothetical protein